MKQLKTLLTSTVAAFIALILCGSVAMAIITSGTLQLQSGTGFGIQFQTNGANTRGTINSAGSWNLQNGALATNATDGFTYIPSSAGTPTGAPTAISGGVPMEWDTTNHFLYGNDTGTGTWKLVGPLVAGTGVTITSGTISASGGGSGDVSWGTRMTNACQTALGVSTLNQPFLDNFQNRYNERWVQAGGAPTVAYLAPGVLKLTTGTITGTLASLGSVPALTGTNQWCVVARVKITKSTLTGGSAFYFGVTGVSGNVGIGWSYAKSTTNFWATSDDAVTASDIVSTVALDTSYHDLMLYYETTGTPSINFVIDGVASGTPVSTPHVGSGDLYPLIQWATNASVAWEFDVDNVAVITP